MLPAEVKFSGSFFFMSTIVILLPACEKLGFPFVWGLNSRFSVVVLLSLFYTVLVLYIAVHHEGFFFQVGIRSVFLGMVFTSGAFVMMHACKEWKVFGLYMCVMSFFHYSEFITIALCNPKTLSPTSFLLNHSTEYNVAAMASWIEFALETYYVPDFKKFHLISGAGFLLCIMGELFRKTAMITGSTNFAHVVQTEKKNKHELVTHGIYSLCRHPSYVGWFYWAIGTQILLLNPFCTIGYAIASWRFFKVRITHEEHTLLYFFGRDYMNYQKTVGTGLPGIKGYMIEE